MCTRRKADESLKLHFHQAVQFSSARSSHTCISTVTRLAGWLRNAAYPSDEVDQDTVTITWENNGGQDFVVPRLLFKGTIHNFWQWQHTHTHTKKCSSWLLPVGEHYLQKVEIAISCLTASCPSKYVGELQCLSVHNPPFTVTLEETCSSSFFGAFYWGDSSSLMWLSCHHSIQTQNIFSMFLT